MITVHHLNNSRSQRVLWLLEELALDYTIVPYVRDASMLAPASLRAVHPLGKAPVIEDDGLVIAESGAIVQHLLERHGQGRLMPPAGTPDRRAFTYWLHYAEGSAMPPLLLKLVFDQIEHGPVPFFVRPITRALARGVKARFIAPQLALHLDHMEAALSQAPWFAGQDFTAADIQMSFAVQAAAARGGLDAERPRLMAWLDRIQSRPGWQRSVARGGPFSLA
jgi:glutathione S-transferase